MAEQIKKQQEQPQTTDTVTPQLIPPESEPDRVGEVLADIMQEIFDYREDLGMPKRWNRFYKLRKSKMWKQSSAADGSVLQSVNMLAPHTQRSVNMLSANNPTFDLVHIGQTAEDTEQKLEIINATIQDFWNEEEQQGVLEASQFIGEVSGSVAEKATYNGKKNFPDGEVEFESIDPFYYGMYPVRTKKVADSEAFLHFYSKSVREAQRTWPEKASDIVADSTLIENANDQRDASIQGQSSTQKVLQYLQGFTSGSTGGTPDSQETWIIECWVKDYTEKNGKAKYTGNIRRIKACCGGNVILEDIDNPSINPELPDDVKQKSYLYSRFPFSHTQSNTDPVSPFGISDYEQLEQLNMGLNKAVTQFVNFKDKASHLKQVNPRNTGVPNDDFTNQDGILNPTNHIVAQAIRYVNPPVMSQDIPAAIQMFQGFFNNVAGTFSDVMQGQKQGTNVVAAKAIAMLLEQASLMMSGKLHNYTKMIRERGRMYLSLASNFYSGDRWVTISKDGKKEPTQVTRELLQSPIRLSVINGSTMPVSRIQEREEALTLLKAGAIDQEEILRLFDIPNRRQIIKRMQTPLIQQWLAKLAAIQVPKSLLQLFMQVAQMDDKEIQKALEEHVLPAFPEILQKLIQASQGQQDQQQIQQQQAQQIQEQMQQLQLAEQQAKVKELEAKALLAQEKAASEKIDQEVKIQGINFDKEKLKMTRAEVISKLRNTAEKGSVTGTGGAEYNERGLKSNNQE